MASTNINSRKRKSFQTNVVFEVDDDDISPVQSPKNAESENFESAPKIMRPNDCNLQSVADKNEDTIHDLDESLSIKDNTVSVNKVNEEDKQLTNATEDTMSDFTQRSDVTNNFEFQDSGIEVATQDIIFDQNSDCKIHKSSQDTNNDLSCNQSQSSNQKEDIITDLNNYIQTENSEDTIIQIEHLKNELANLEEKNVKLEKELSILQRKMCVCNVNINDDDKKPAFVTNFFNKEVEDKYKKQIVNFYNSITEFQIKQDDAVVKIFFEKKIDNVNVVDTSEIDKCAQDDLRKHLTKKKKSKKKKNSNASDSFFIVDTMPSLNSNQKSLRYLSKFTIEANTNESEEDESKVLPQNTCFNCDGNHSFRECPEPKNIAKIKAARMKLREKQSKLVRYHLDEDQKFSHLQPGKLSENLRDALGLDDNELPPYIYKMRSLGYPPGWIAEFQEKSSDLCLFDIEGKDMNKSKSKRTILDKNNIIDYPGFNVPMEKGVKDDYKYHRCPPFSEKFSKENMIQYIESTFAKCQNNLQQHNIEIEDGENTNIDNNKPKGTNLESEENSQEEESLDSLELRKKKLLAELNEASSLKNTDEDTNNSEIQNELDTSQNSEKLDLEINTTRTPDVSEEVYTITKAVKTSSFGTPILKSASPFSKLPHPDNFAQNVSPVINFENLPNSTGKYEQMTEVLMKVRKTLKNTFNEKQNA